MNRHPEYKDNTQSTEPIIVNYPRVSIPLMDLDELEAVSSFEQVLESFGNKMYERYNKSTLDIIEALYKQLQNK